jgi:DNA-binding transcriptional regulator LsrR (DeoR family)
MLQKQGAVGDICLRFIDAKGRPVKGAHDERVIGMDLERVRRVQRSVAVCGGKRKFAAILGAVRGRWINTLVTDQHTAARLVNAQPGKATGG